VIAPWREWDIVSREDALAYAAKHGVPVQQSKKDIYSRRQSLAPEPRGGRLEDPANAPEESMFKLTRGLADHPPQPERVSASKQERRCRRRASTDPVACGEAQRARRTPRRAGTISRRAGSWA
jgi:hypothetical protein